MQIFMAYNYMFFEIRSELHVTCHYDRSWKNVNSKKVRFRLEFCFFTCQSSTIEEHCILLLDEKRMKLRAWHVILIIVMSSIIIMWIRRWKTVFDCVDCIYVNHVYIFVFERGSSRKIERFLGHKKYNLKPTWIFSCDYNIQA